MNEVRCSCGKKHEDMIDVIRIETDITEVILQAIKGYAKNEVVFVTDQPVAEAYKKLINQLADYPIHIFERKEALVPDEKAVGELFLFVGMEVKLIIGIGSGTLNDLCRYVSYRLKIPYWIIMSAPSMDGYASTASPLITHNFKKTFYCKVAKRVYASREVLDRAPINMVLAGMGDLFGKVTALLDWRVSHIINGEYICQDICEDLYKILWDLKESVEENLIDNAMNLDSIKAMGTKLGEGLNQSGIYMSYVGNSRPASGSEHLISHCLEMKALKEHKKVDLHGLKVGMATHYMLGLYRFFLEHIEEVQKKLALSDEQVTDIIKAINTAMAYKEIVKLYYKTSQEVMSDHSIEDIIEAMMLGIKIRDRYTILSTFDQLNWLNEKKLREIIAV